MTTGKSNTIKPSVFKMYHSKRKGPNQITGTNANRKKIYKWKPLKKREICLVHSWTTKGPIPDTFRVTRRQESNPFLYTCRRYNHTVIWWVSEMGSLAFMLPVAIPPNALIFDSKRIAVIQMTNSGFVWNLIGIIIVLFIIYYLEPWYLI